MANKNKVGRPANPGKVIGFYAPKDLLEKIDLSLQATGGTVSVFLRDAVEDAANKTLKNYKGHAVQQSTLKTYTGGKVEP